jgi:predicted amidophosphoribosyltransferase
MHRLIPAHKERQAWLLTAALADQLTGAVELLLIEELSGQAGVTLVPVPSSPAAVRARGRDATAAIAEATARRLRRRTGRRVGVARLLRPVRRLADQSELSAGERRRNLAGAYAVRPGRIPRQPTAVVLVDDLVTTGSSLAEARRAVSAAGLPLVGAAVIAAAVRRRPPRPRAR